MIELETATGTATVALVLSVVPAPAEQLLIGIQVGTMGTAAALPDPLQVQLLDPQGAVLEQGRDVDLDTDLETCYLEIEGVAGEQFQVVLTTDRDRRVYQFAI